MNISTVLILVGLIFNTLASLMMMYPYLNIRRNVDDDFIIDIDKETGEYTQKKHIKDRRLGMAGFFLFTIGFALQLIGVVAGI